jgi:hypothetical protein
MRRKKNEIKVISSEEDADFLVEAMWSSVFILL